MSHQQAYVSEDLGDYNVVITPVFDYALDNYNYLVVTDDRVDGLCHVYYGNSLEQGKSELHTLLGQDAERILSEISEHFSK
jgi:hypothetical protein